MKRKTTRRNEQLQLQAGATAAFEYSVHCNTGQQHPPVPRAPGESLRLPNGGCSVQTVIVPVSSPAEL